MKEYLERAGQYLIDAIEVLQPTGKALDVRDQVQQVTLYEDLFSPFMSGNLVCIDSVDLPSLFLNAGADLLHLRLRTPTLEKENVIDRYFHIYKMSDRTELSDRSQTYILHFVNKDSIIDSSINISKTFRKKGETNIGDILKKTMNSDMPFIASPTTNDVIYTSNYWSPLKNIAYNCDHSIAQDKTPTFIFFENRYGYNFAPVTGLTKAKTFKKFKASDHVAEINNSPFNLGKVTRDLEKDYATIMKVAVDVTYDYEKDKREGLMSSRLFSFDLTTKKLVDTTYNMNQETRDLMNENRFYTKQLVNTSYTGAYSSVILTGNKHTKLYNNTNDVTDLSFKQRRISILRHFQQHKIEITVFGRTDYTVGMTVDIDINRLKKFTKDNKSEELPDPLLTGKYLVSAICHRFDREGKHESTLELIRDSIGANK